MSLGHPVLHNSIFVGWVGEVCMVVGCRIVELKVYVGVVDAVFLLHPTDPHPHLHTHRYVGL